ncbi:MAG: hypothetical protein QM756_04755 [Polyangiaceae bacterium]
MIKHQVIAASLLALGAFACSGGNAVDIGEDHPVKTGATLSDYAAVWDGYAEAYRFPSGSDRVRITLDENGHGYVEFGDQPLLAPPTDPNAGYANTLVGTNYFDTLEEGFRYSALFANVQAKRFRLGVENDELMKAWCELQTPVSSNASSSGYACIPNLGWRMPTPGVCIMDTDAGPTEVSCDKALLCGLGTPCTCTAQSCTVTPPTSLALTATTLDAALENEGNTLTGTLLMGGTERVTVRLERQ